MVEPLLYVALGFLVASLLGVFMARAVWNRAVRLTTRRVMRRLPVSQTEIVGARDLVRAEHAVATRTLERRYAQVQSHLTATLAEIGRRDIGLNRLETNLAEARMTVGALEARESAARQELGRASSELSSTRKTLDAVQRALNETRQRLERAEAGRAELRVLADTRQVEIMGLQSELDGLRTRAGAIESEAAGGRRAVTDAAERANAAAEQLARERSRADALASKLKHAEAALEASRREAEEAIGGLEVKVEVLRAEKSVVEGSLAAARAVAPDPSDMSLLRQRIEDLAGQIVRSTDGPGASAPEAPPRERAAPQTLETAAARPLRAAPV